MNPDFKDLLSIFNANGVEFIIVGAHALAAHGLVRATKDMDVWVRPAPANAKLVFKALGEFGAPLGDLTIEDLSRSGLIFQIGVAPIRIDIITAIDGVTFEDAWHDRFMATFADEAVSVLSRGHLIQNKRAAGRDQDLVDVKWLERETR
jgi:hypothetical protein